MFGFISGALSFIASAATSIVGTLANVLKTVGVALTGAGQLVENLGKSLGLIEEHEDAVTLGRQCQAAEEMDINPDDFESFDDYVAKVRTLDVDKNINVDELENKDEITRKGMDLIMSLAVEKFGQSTMEKVGDIIGKDPENASLVLNSKSVSDFVADDKDNLERVAGYLKGENLSSEVRDVILDGISASKPELSEEESLKVVNDIRERVEGNQ